MTTSHDELARSLYQAGRTALNDGLTRGEDIVRSDWPHLKPTRTLRRISERQKLSVFKADGFRCRYTGDLLFFAAYLTALSALWPETFPAHPHGKSDLAHAAYWSHFASVEHLDPISVGGAETEANWITTSMGRNQVRSRYSLQALGWQVLPRQPRSDWDGGVELFLQLFEAHPEIANGQFGTYLTRWRKVVLSVGSAPEP